VIDRKKRVEYCPLKEGLEMKRTVPISALVFVALVSMVCGTAVALNWRCYEMGGDGGCFTCFTTVPDTDCSVTHHLCYDGWEMWEITCAS